MFKKYWIFILLFFITHTVHAGITRLSQHSRANCGNNESITWDATSYHELGTVSKHYRNGKWLHDVNTGWQNTWRSAAIHWGEALPGSGWRVIGYHWMKINGLATLIDVTDVSDCSIYDGWLKKNNIDSKGVL